MRAIWSSLLAVVVACKPGNEQGSASKAPPTKDPVAIDKAHEIAKEPRTAMAGRTGFLEFTIDVPPSASMPVQGPTETSWSFKDSKLQLAITEFNEVPSQSRDKGGWAPRANEGIARTLKEEPGAFLVVDRHDDATGFKLQYCMDLDPAQPPSGICCRVELGLATPIIDIDKLITFGEQMCRSMKPRNRTIVPRGATGSGSGSAR